MLIAPVKGYWRFGRLDGMRCLVLGARREKSIAFDWISQVEHQRQGLFALRRLGDY